MATETFRLRHQRVEALARRAQMLEYAIADATRPEEVLAIAGCSGTNHEATVSRLGEVDLK
jgi:hypothetical protein